MKLYFFQFYPTLIFLSIRSSLSSFNKIEKKLEKINKKLFLILFFMICPNTIKYFLIYFFTILLNITKKYFLFINLFFIEITFKET